MKSLRSTIRTLVVLLGLAAPLYAVEAASAGSLLSGYGGPGQGNQAILGSTLLGGASGGGGGASGGGGGGGEASLAASGSSIGAAAGSGSGGGSSPRASRHAHHSTNGSSRAVVKSPAPAGPTQLAPAAAKTTEGSQPLGLSGRDLLYVLLALVLLAATAALTLRLARPAPSAGSTKGIRSRTRVTE